MSGQPKDILITRKDVLPPIPSAHTTVAGISEKDHGEVYYDDLLAMTKKYPATHRNNILRRLESVHGQAETQSDWLKRRVQLSDNELITLARTRFDDPIISRAIFPKLALLAIAEKEPRRADLARWLAGSKARQLEFIDNVEFRLFTDQQEISIGWEPEQDGQQRGWVMRTARLANEDRAISENLRYLKGLVPETRLIEGENDTLILSEFIDGNFATAQEIEAFKQEVARRELPGNIQLDIAHDNIVKTKDGRLIYTDRDYLGIKNAVK